MLNQLKATQTIPELHDPNSPAAVFALTFVSFANQMSSQNGTILGLILCQAHRTLQRSIIVLCLDIIRGLATQEYTDARNETAIATAKKISTMIDTNDFPLGPFM